MISPEIGNQSGVEEQRLVNSETSGIEMKLPDVNGYNCLSEVCRLEEGLEEMNKIIAELHQNINKKTIEILEWKLENLRLTAIQELPNSNTEEEIRMHKEKEKMHSTLIDAERSRDDLVAELRKLRKKPIQMPICFVEFNPRKITTSDSEQPRYVCNRRELMRISEAAKNEVGDAEIIFLSIVGITRTGKSFLLNLLIRYLNSVKHGDPIPPNWWTDKDLDMQGFNWRGGDDRCTSGIWIWSKPFRVGNSFLFLIDSEGISDGKAEDDVLISLVISFSSLMMINAQSRVDDCCLKLLAICGDLVQRLIVVESRKDRRPAHGETCAGASGTADRADSLIQVNSEGKLACSVLFLLRDWPPTKVYPCGEDGGRRYVRSKLENIEENTPDSNDAKRMINNTFGDSVSGFLLPRPGNAIAECEDERPISECESDQRFKDCFSAFCQYLFCPENGVKKCHTTGRPLTLQDLPNYMDKMFTLAISNVKNGQPIQTHRHMLVRCAVESSLSTFATTASKQPMENQEQFEKALKAGSAAVNEHYKYQLISVDTPESPKDLNEALMEVEENMRRIVNSRINEYVESSFRLAESDLAQGKEMIIDSFREFIVRLQLGSEDFVLAAVNCLRLCLMKTDEVLCYVREQMGKVEHQIFVIDPSNSSFKRYEDTIIKRLANSQKCCRQYVKNLGLNDENFELVISRISFETQNKLLEFFCRQREDTQIIKQRIKCEREFDETIAGIEMSISITDLENILINYKQRVVDSFLHTIGPENSNSTLGQQSRSRLEEVIDEKIVLHRNRSSRSMSALGGLAMIPDGVPLATIVGIGVAQGAVPLADEVYEGFWHGVYNILKVIGRFLLKKMLWV